MKFQRFGPFEVVGQIGRGGMGAVYEGVSSTGERRAIKVLSPFYADDPDFRSRFETEINTLEQLKHPNIVRLTGFGEEEGCLFYTMELVEGPNLQEELNRGRRFGWKEVVDISLDICSALRHAHDRGIIHRDLKPANLMTSASGDVKLTDFGIAKLFGGSQLTMAGGIIGTADYMAPEQAESRPVTSKSDLYSLGSVMYALLARRPPFSSSSRTVVINSLLHERPEPLHRVAVGVPTPLEDIIEQLLEKEPEDRIATAQALANRLKSMRFGLESSASSPTGVSKSPARPNQTQLPGPTAEVPLSGDEKQGEESRYWKETVVAQTAATESTAVPKSSHPAATVYTEVAEDKQPEQSESTAEQPDWSGRLSTIAVAVTFVGLLALAWFLSRPKSADVLFQEIEAVTSKRSYDKYVDVRRQMDDFVERFPDDQRSAQVDAWRQDHQWYKLWRRLERQVHKLGAIDLLGVCREHFVRGSRSDNATDIDQAIRHYGQLLRECGAADDPEIRECRAAAKHRLGQLKGD